MVIGFPKAGNFLNSQLGTAVQTSDYLLLAEFQTAMAATCLAQLDIVSGAAESGSSQVVMNAVTGRSLEAGLDTALLSGAATGGVGGAAGHRVGSALRSLKSSPSRPADSPFYSVFFEAQLQRGKHFPGQTRGHPFPRS